MRRSAAGTRRLLGDLDAKSASKLIENSSDLALLLDGEGRIIDVLGAERELARLGPNDWRGRTWIDTVTVESREKVAAMLRDAESELEHPRWRQVNHPTRGGDDLPMLYAAVRIVEDGRTPASGRIVAFGRDLRATVALQKRLVEAQQAMERDYWRFREAETRYRNLFQTAPEAVLIVEAATLKVAEANPAAETLWGRARARIAGAQLPALFDPVGVDALESMLAAVRGGAKMPPVRAALLDGATHVSVSATAFRQDDATYLLVRLLPWRSDAALPAKSLARGRRGAGPALAPVSASTIAAGIDPLPDAIAYTDAQGRVLAANRAFAALAQLASAEQARGQVLDHWVGNTGVELSVLIGNLRQHGSVGLFVTTLRGESGAAAEVEIAASVLPPESGAVLAFVLRDIGRRLAATERAEPRLPRSAGEMTELVGRVPLRQIVTETTDLIEQLCIETALQMTGDNRASASQLLGLSRQSLYVKLRRFGLADRGGEDAEA